jgi:hypothetical protein
MGATQDIPNTNLPHATYSQLLEAHRARLALRQKWDTRLGVAKVALGVLTIGLVVWFLYRLHGIWPAVAAAAVFVGLAILHERVLRAIKSLKAIVAYYERGLARLEDRWAGTGQQGMRFLDAAHPYARDLDIFGSGSLFELLCIVSTRMGEETLARWLLEPATLDEIDARQAAIRELTGETAFREELFTAGNRVHSGLYPDRLIAWGERKEFFGSRWLSLLLAVLALVWIAAVVSTFFTNSYTAVLLSSCINVAVSSFLRKNLTESAEAIEMATEDLDLLVEVLKVLERTDLSSPRLESLRAALAVESIKPSVAMKKLDRITRYLLHRRNLFVRLFLGFLFYTAQCTMLGESWRKKFGAAIRGWLTAVGEMEALAALSAYAFEHPGDSWPEFDEKAACFDAEGMAHPLLPANKAVCNDLSLGDGLRLMILSGPNMAGKSTFVRGIGMNAVLAQCGAPVRATRLRMSRLAVGASICVLDSLQGGVSRFYAEIQRLKLILDLTHGSVPVLFLFDELLSGTNSHDRLDGTRFLVDSLVRRGAIGIVTTHDLALAQIPESMNGSARNYHFEDHLENGVLAFDYKLKTGVVQTSNALKLMQSIGLMDEDCASMERKLQG